MPFLPVPDLVAHLQSGQIVALPTDTVPGLAICVDAPQAAAKLSALKGYPSPRPFSLHFSSLEQLAKLAPSLPPGLAKWLRRSLPHGITAVVPSAWLALPKAWHWPWPAVGLRLPSNEEFCEVAEQISVPLMMTSVNPAGAEPLFGEDLHAWLQGNAIPSAASLARSPATTPSAVVEFDPLPHLRRGQLPLAQLLPGMRILVLCSGNICRSPVGEAMLQAEVAAAWGVREADLAALGWHFASAGTFAMPDGPVSEHSLAVAAEVGLDLRQHRSANLEDLLQEPWDLILGMGMNHLASLPATAPQDLFDPFGLPVPDPFGGPKQAYQVMCAHLQRATEERIKLWSIW